jgi:hypothetical protein
LKKLKDNNTGLIDLGVALPFKAGNLFKKGGNEEYQRLLFGVGICSIAFFLW